MIDQRGYLPTEDHQQAARPVKTRSLPLCLGANHWKEGTMSSELAAVVPGEHGGVLLCRNCGQTLIADDEGRGCKRCNWYEEWEEGEPSEWVQIVYGDPRPVGIDQSARVARVVEFTRLVAGYAVEFDDMEVIPPTATSKAVISIAGHSAPAEDLYRRLEEQAAGFGMTAEEFLELGLAAERLLSELNDPPEERQG
jgi:hypothetical protein